MTIEDAAQISFDLLQSKGLFLSEIKEIMKEHIELYDDFKDNWLLRVILYTAEIFLKIFQLIKLIPIVIVYWLTHNQNLLKYIKLTLFVVSKLNPSKTQIEISKLVLKKVEKIESLYK